MRSQELEVHYIMPQGVHSADAFKFLRSDNELLHLIQEVSNILELDIQLETEAIGEGGIFKRLKVVNDNYGTLIATFFSVLVGVVTIVILKNSMPDPELTSLQKENLRLNNEKTEIEIELLRQNFKEQQEVDEKQAIKAAEKILNDIKVVKRRSNYYEALESEERIEAVEFKTSIDKVETQKTVKISRSEFRSYIRNLDSLPPEIDENAIIEIISPVLKRGRYKWKGYYEDQPINFTVKDKEFKESVLNKEYNFHNGTAIDCVLKMDIKVDDAGIVTRSGFSVQTVKKVLDQYEKNETITSSGEAYYAVKKTEKNQQTFRF